MVTGTFFCFCMQIKHTHTYISMHTSALVNTVRWLFKLTAITAYLSSIRFHPPTSLPTHSRCLFLFASVFSLLQKKTGKFNYNHEKKAAASTTNALLMTWRNCVMAPWEKKPYRSISFFYSIESTNDVIFISVFLSQINSISNGNRSALA